MMTELGKRLTKAVGGCRFYSQYFYPDAEEPDLRGRLYAIVLELERAAANRRWHGLAIAEKCAVIRHIALAMDIVEDVMHIPAYAFKSLVRVLAYGDAFYEVSKPPRRWDFTAISMVGSRAEMDFGTSLLPAFREAAISREWCPLTVRVCDEDDRLAEYQLRTGEDPFWVELAEQGIALYDRERDGRRNWPPRRRRRPRG
jgi:hypothetical protein